MTEMQVFESLCQWAKSPLSDKGQAREFLLERISREPAWLAVLPESLLTKLGIPFDYQFDQKDIALAQAVHGRCARRIL
jgi:hypothetical protein